MSSPNPDYFDWYQRDNLLGFKFGQNVLKYLFEKKIKPQPSMAPHHEITVEKIQYRGIRNKRLQIHVQVHARGRGTFDPNLRCRCNFAILPVLRDSKLTFEANREGKFDCDKNFLIKVLEVLFGGGWLINAIIKALTGTSIFEQIFESIASDAVDKALRDMDPNVKGAELAIKELENTGLIRLENVWAGRENRPSEGLWLDFGFRLPDLEKIKEVISKYNWKL